MWNWNRIRRCWCTAERSSHGYCNDWRSFDRPCPSRTVTLDAAACAKKLSAVTTYDPNYRANLWKNKEEAIAQMKVSLPLVDILKVSDEELDTLTVDKLESILAFANKAASITTSRHGAIPAMPTLEEIEK